MANLIFHAVKFKNLLSYGNNWTELSLDAVPMTMVSGQNGVGKSCCVLESLSVGLYGKPFRNAKKKASVINSVNGKELEIVVSLTVEGNAVEIHRGMKPDFLRVSVNGSPHALNDSPDTRIQQKMLEDIIKIPRATMMQLSLLGSARYGSFMDLEPSERAKIIEQVLDIGIISKMAAGLVPRVTKNTTDIGATQTEVSKLDGLIEGKDSLLQHLANDTTADSLKSELTDIQDELNKLRTAHDELLTQKPDSTIDYDGLPLETPETLPTDLPMPSKPEIADIADFVPSANLSEVKADIEQTEDKIVAARTKGSEMSSEKKRLAADVAFFGGNDTCPTCTQKITERFKTDKTFELTKRISKIDKTFPLMDEVISDLNQHLTALRAIVTEVQDKETEHKVALANRREALRRHELECENVTRENVRRREHAIKQHQMFRNEQIAERKQKVSAKIKEWESLCRESSSKITTAEAAIKRLESNIKQADNTEKMKALFAELKTLKREKKTLDEKLRELLKERELLNAAKLMFKNNAGIRAYILKKWLPILNAYISEYLDRLGAMYGFTLDENFKEVILARYRDSMSYDNFSEGEKKRIDMALLLAFRRISQLKSSAFTSILVLDEVMDSSLDDAGTTSLLESFSEIDVAKNIFVVSHKLSNTAMFDRVLTVRKEGNFSVVNEE